MQVHPEESQFVCLCSLCSSSVQCSPICFPKIESGQREKYPARWRGTVSAARGHARALTPAATQKPVLIYLIPPHFLHPKRTVKIHQRLHFLRRTARGNYLYRS